MSIEDLDDDDLMSLRADARDHYNGTKAISEINIRRIGPAVDELLKLRGQAESAATSAANDLRDEIVRATVPEVLRAYVEKYGPDGISDLAAGGLLGRFVGRVIDAAIEELTGWSRSGGRA